MTSARNSSRSVDFVFSQRIQRILLWKIWPVCLSDGAHSLADVLSRQDHVARPTPEAADVPLLLQRQERLTLLDLVSAARAVWRRQEGAKKEGHGARRSQSAFKEFLCVLRAPEASSAIDKGADAAELRASSCC